MVPVEAGGLGFDIGWIAGADLPGQIEEFGTGEQASGKVGGLGADFCLNQLFPQLLTKWLADGELLIDPPYNLAMIGKREENRGGEVVTSANDEGRVGLGEFGERGVGIGGLLLIDQNDADVLAGDTADDQTSASDLQLVEFHSEVGRLLGDFDCALDHG